MLENDKNIEVENVKKKTFWDKRIVFVIEVFLTVISLIIFILGVVISNDIVEGIASNCFTAFIVTVAFSIVDWNTETDVEKAMNSVERETKNRIEAIQASTIETNQILNNNIHILQQSISTFSNVVALYNGKACTFCKNNIKSVKLNRDECNLTEFFDNAQESICILATNLQSFTDYLPIFSKKAKAGVNIRVATIHPNFARSFNIANVVGHSGPEKRWKDMKQSLLRFLSFAEEEEDEGHIVIKTYSSITPTLILMIVDQQCYVSYLLHGHRSRETPHFLFTNEGNNSASPVESFIKHFEGIWSDPGTCICEYESIYRLEYKLQPYSFVGWQFANSIYVNGLTICSLYDILLNIWSFETCTQRMRKDWNEKKPYVGQCTITAFLVQDIFGGEVYGVLLEDGHYHSYNVIEGFVFDLTSEQFNHGKLVYKQENRQSREQHFSIEDKYQRYQKLKNKFSETINAEWLYLQKNV